MLGQVRLGDLDQLRAGEQVEESDRVDPLRAAPNPLSMLLRTKCASTLCQGWPRGCVG
jgi:hypothetical protein